VSKILNSSSKVVSQKRKVSQKEMSPNKAFALALAQRYQTPEQLFAAFNFG